MTEASDESSTMRIARAHGFVQGRVQGVWFRDSTQRRAVELGLAGFVRNLPDGRVEAEFVGPIAAVKQALEFIEQGPPDARVDRLDGFEIDEIRGEMPSRAVEFLIR